MGSEGGEKQTNPSLLSDIHQHRPGIEQPWFWDPLYTSVLQRGTILQLYIFNLHLLFILHFGSTLNLTKHLAASDYIMHDAVLASIWPSLCRDNPAQLASIKRWLQPISLLIECGGGSTTLSSFHPPISPSSSLQSRDRLTHMNHLSVMRLLTPLQSGPWRSMAQWRHGMSTG